MACPLDISLGLLWALRLSQSSRICSFTARESLRREVGSTLPRPDRYSLPRRKTQGRFDDFPGIDIRGKMLQASQANFEARTIPCADPERTWEMQGAIPGALWNRRGVLVRTVRALRKAQPIHDPQPRKVVRFQNPPSVLRSAQRSWTALPLEARFNAD